MHVTQLERELWNGNTDEISVEAQSPELSKDRVRLCEEDQR